MGHRQHNRVQQRKALLTVLAVVLAGLVYGILLGNNGIRGYLELRATLQRRASEAYSRIARNRRLLEHLEGLRTDKRTLEEVARSRLGVTGEDEIVYVFRSADDWPSAMKP